MNFWKKIRWRISFPSILQSCYFQKKICISGNNIYKLHTFLPVIIIRSSHLEVFLGRGVLKICSKFTGEHPCQSAISIKLQSNFIEILLWHGCSPVNLLHILRTASYKNTFRWVLLHMLQINITGAP